MILWLRRLLRQWSLLLMWRKLFRNVFRSLLRLVWAPLFHFRGCFVIRWFEFRRRFWLFPVLKILRSHLLQSFLHKLLKRLLSLLSWCFFIWGIILLNIFSSLLFEFNLDWLTGYLDLLFWNKLNWRRFWWVDFQAARGFILCCIAFVFFEIWACNISFCFLSFLMFL